MTPNPIMKKIAGIHTPIKNILDLLIRKPKYDAIIIPAKKTQFVEKLKIFRQAAYKGYSSGVKSYSEIIPYPNFPLFGWSQNS
jgi:hypothetical protein